MRNKEKRLKKNLLQKVGLTFLLVVAIGTAVFFLFNYRDGLNSSKTTKQNQNNSIKSQKEEIEKTLGLNETTAKDYAKYMQEHNPDFILKREMLNDILPVLRKQHHFANDMEVVISAANEVTDANFKIKSGKLLQSNVKIKFSALTDNSVYKLIYDLQHKLPGIIMVSSLKLERTADISSNIVSLAVNEHTISPAINGELSLVWIGIKKDTPDEDRKEAK